MSVEFQAVVFDESMNGMGAITCDVTLQELFGRADRLVFQFHVGRAAGTFPTLSATYSHSNDGTSYSDHTVLLTNQSIATPPYDAMLAVSGGTIPLGLYGRLTLQLGGDSPSASVRVVVCGRSDDCPLVP